MLSDAIAVALISLVGGFISAFVAIKIQRPVSQADAAAKIEAASAHFSEMVKKDNTELRAENAELRLEVDRLAESVEIMQKRQSRLEIEFNALLDGAWRLHNQVSARGDVPVYTPPRRPITGPLGVGRNE